MVDACHFITSSQVRAQFKALDDGVFMAISDFSRRLEQSGKGKLIIDLTFS